MKKIDTNNKSREELTAMLKDLHTKFTRSQFDAAEKKLKDSSQLGKMKRDIARVLTALNK